MSSKSAEGFINDDVSVTVPKRHIDWSSSKDVVSGERTLDAIQMHNWDTYNWTTHISASNYELFFEKVRLSFFLKSLLYQ